MVKTRGKIRTLKFSTVFLKVCISQRVALKYIVGGIERSRARHSPEMKRAFSTDDIVKLTEQSRKLQTVYQLYWRRAREFLTFFDTIRFCRYLEVQYLMKKRNKSLRSKTSDYLFHSDVTVLAMLLVILQDIF